MSGRPLAAHILLALCLSILILGSPVLLPPGPRNSSIRLVQEDHLISALASNNSAVGNFSASINRLVLLLGAAGSGLLALVWARVALSWFSNDVSKKIQAKDRARDALIGTLLFTAAITGLAWGLAHWVLTGS